MRMYTVAIANSAVRPSPNSANEMTIRLRSLRRYRIRIDHAVSDAVARLDQRLVERLVDRGAKAVNVHAQRIRIGQLLAPHARLELLARDDRRRRFHERLQQLEADRV